MNVRQYVLQVKRSCNMFWGVAGGLRILRGEQAKLFKPRFDMPKSIRPSSRPGSLLRRSSLSAGFVVFSPGAALLYFRVAVDG